jgi:hypothetical protein
MAKGEIGSHEPRTPDAAAIVIVNPAKRNTNVADGRRRRT